MIYLVFGGATRHDDGVYQFLGGKDRLSHPRKSSTTADVPPPATTVGRTEPRMSLSLPPVGFSPRILSCN